MTAAGVQVELGSQMVVQGADLEVGAGELVAITGPNAAGKSTLLRAAAGLQRLTAGEVRWRDRSVGSISPRSLARLRAYLPQRPRLPAGLTVADAVAAGRAPHVGMLGRPAAADRAAVRAALGRTGVAGLAGRALETLSGGEQQRAFLALALAQEAPALLADEPTAQLDLGARWEIGGLLRELTVQGLGVAVVLHDLDLACAMADRIVVMHEGRVAAAGDPATVVTPRLLRSVWGLRARVETENGRPRVVPLGPIG